MWQVVDEEPGVPGTGVQPNSENCLFKPISNYLLEMDVHSSHTHTHIILQTKCELPVAVPPVPALSTPQGLVYSIQTIHV